ncbi:hypothetical protein [Huintestinicola sp.]|uniref:hypothetical protein n=1 Tax=Huintestinicola sp. TaxID=2981661 RepID=UPI003D7CC5BF
MDNIIQCEQLLSPLFSAKKYHSDMIYDYLTMIAERLMTFGNKIEADYKRNLEANIKRLVVYSRSPIQNNRVYIISDMEYILFAALHMSDLNINSIKNDLEFSAQINKIPNYLDYPPCAVATLYVFSISQETYRINIAPHELAYLLHKYRNENLINDYDI